MALSNPEYSFTLDEAMRMLVAGGIAESWLEPFKSQHNVIAIWHKLCVPDAHGRRKLKKEVQIFLDVRAAATMHAFHGSNGNILSTEETMALIIKNCRDNAHAAVVVSADPDDTDTVWIDRHPVNGSEGESNKVCFALADAPDRYVTKLRGSCLPTFEIAKQAAPGFLRINQQSDWSYDRALWRLERFHGGGQNALVEYIHEKARAGIPMPATIDDVGGYNAYIWDLRMYNDAVTRLRLVCKDWAELYLPSLFQLEATVPNHTLWAKKQISLMLRVANNKFVVHPVVFDNIFTEMKVSLFRAEDGQESNLFNVVAMARDARPKVMLGTSQLVTRGRAGKNCVSLGIIRKSNIRGPNALERQLAPPTPSRGGRARPQDPTFKDLQITATWFRDDKGPWFPEDRKLERSSDANLARAGLNPNDVHTNSYIAGGDNDSCIPVRDVPPGEWWLKIELLAHGLYSARVSASTGVFKVVNPNQKRKFEDNYLFNGQSNALSLDVRQ